MKHGVQGTLQIYVACDQHAAEFLLIKNGIETSWAPHPGFEPPPSEQQAGMLPLNSVSCFIAHHIFVDIFITIDPTVMKFGSQTETEQIDIL